jgi:hypothetical protein
MGTNYIDPGTIDGHELSGSGQIIPAPLQRHIYAGEQPIDVDYPHAKSVTTGSVYGRPSYVLFTGNMSGSQDTDLTTNWYFLFSGSAADATDLNNYVNLGNGNGFNTTGSTMQLNIQPIAYSASFGTISDNKRDQIATGSVLFYYDHKLK